MAKAFVFKSPQLTVKNLADNTTTVVGDENFAEDGVTITLSSDAREVSRFNGTDKFPSGKVNVEGTVATILEGDDIWKLFKVFNIPGLTAVTLANGKVGVEVGDGDICAASDAVEVVIEDKCRDAADVHKRIKLTNVSFAAEDLELAFNNSNGITPEIAMYCSADANGVKALLGYDEVTP